MSSPISAILSNKRKAAESSSDSFGPSKPGKLSSIGRTHRGLGSLRIPGRVPTATTSVVRSHRDSSAVVGSVMASAIRSESSGSSVTTPMALCPRRPKKPAAVVFTGPMSSPLPGFDPETKRTHVWLVFGDHDCYEVPIDTPLDDLVVLHALVIPTPMSRPLALVSSDLTLMSILTFTYTNAYVKYKAMFPDAESEFLETLPPRDLATLTLGGMTHEQIQLMSQGHSWQPAEYFPTLGHIDEGLGHVGLYHVEAHHKLTNESVLDHQRCLPPMLKLPQDPDVSVTVIIPYEGSAWRLDNNQLAGRGQEHLSASHRKFSPSKPLYQAIKSANTVLSHVAVDVKLCPSFITNYGPSPLLIMEHCLALLKGTFCPRSKKFTSYSRTGGSVETWWDETWDFLPPPLVSAFARHAGIHSDGGTKTFDIMNQAIGWGGANASLPIVEIKPDMLPNVVTRMSQPTPIKVRSEVQNKGTICAMTISHFYVMLFSVEQTQEMVSRGFVFRTEDNASTLTMLQLILTDNDDDDHWANLPVGVESDLFEDARKVVLQLTWVHPQNGSNESIKLRFPDGAYTTPTARARRAMTLLEYSTGTLIPGADTGPTRADFFKSLDNKDLSSGEGPRCPVCNKIFRSVGSVNDHFRRKAVKGLEDCREYFENEMTVAERKAFKRFFKCKQCHSEWDDVAGLKDHIGRPTMTACLRAYNGGDPTLEDSSIYIL